MFAEQPKELTPEQKAVVVETEGSFVVRASAGTGKTTTLVARYLKHVTEDGLRPDQILTITFTRKAAAEMKKRIVKALIDRGLRDEAQIAETGPIQTIHGFCERILRECSVDAGLDPDFTILDETESTRLMRDAIREAIGNLDSVPMGGVLLEHLAGRRKYLGTSPHGLLEEAVGEVVARLRGSTAKLDDLKVHYSDPKKVELYWREMILDRTPAAVREALAAFPAGLPFGVRLQQAYKSAKVRAPVSLPTPSAAEMAAKLEEDCAMLSCGLMQLATRTWEHFEEANSASGALDFVELERQAVDLLTQSPPAIARMREQYRAALVDESQDMNPIQHRLVEALGIGRLMLVGDAQQSIYGFRQADVRLFEEKAATNKTLQLSENKRSDQGVLRFVDELFAKVWPESYVGMARPTESASERFQGVELWVQKAKDSPQIARWVQELALEEGAGNVAVLTRTLGYAQDLLARLEALHVPARIAGGSERYYTRLEVRDFANGLTSLVNPHDDFALLAALYSPLASLSLDSIVMLAKDKQVWQRLSEFEPPVAEDKSRIESFLSWFEPMTHYADRLPAWEVLSQLLAKSPYLETVARRANGLQTLANARKLLSIAAGMPEADALQFARRMREIREMRHREGDAPISEERSEVTLLTIHKAKGLEFPVVVVPETLSPPRSRSELEIERSSGMLTVSFGAGGAAYHLINAQWRKDRDREELYRLLYVALTRAKNRLCLVVDPSAPPSKLAGDVIEQLGWREGFPPDVRVRHPEPVAVLGTEVST